ncbi:MAG: hypothetical protein V4581_15275 [Bacteroidota bacterium]
MKKSILLIFLGGLASCGTLKNPAASKAIITSICPAAGNCSIEIMKDKSLSIKTDDSKRPYYSIEDMPGRVVVKYAYNKNRNPNYADDGYSEEVIFETDENFTEMDADKGKLLFGVHCFCRGKAGFYKVPDALLTYKNQILHIRLPDLVEGQLTRTVDVKFE